MIANHIKKLAFFLILLAAMVQGCACEQQVVRVPQPYIPQPAPPPQQRYTVYPATNAEQLQQSALSAARLIASSPALMNARKVVVASLERLDVSDYPVHSQVNDAIHESLDMAAIRTLERDPDVMLRLVYQEGTQAIEYLLLNAGQYNDTPWLEHTIHPTVTRGMDNNITSERVVSPGPELVNSYTFGYELPAIVDTRLDNQRLSQLATADYIVGYRVLEHGIQYRQSRNLSAAEPMVQRHALTRLHVRVVNAKTGEVIWARTLEGTTVDEIPQYTISYVEQGGRQNFPSSRPVQAEMAR